MSVSQFLVTWLSISAAVILSLVAVVVYCHERQVIPGGRLLHRFRSLPWYAKIVLIVLVAQCIVHGSTKTNQTDGTGSGITNAPLLGMMFVRPNTDILQPSVSDEDIERGFQHVSVSTNEDVCYVMPEGAEYAGNWHLRGAYDDVSKVEFHDWLFPLGTNVIDHLWVFTWGKVRPDIRDAVHEITAVGAPMSAVPSVSRLWTAKTSSGSRLITWESFIVGRLTISEAMTNAPVINAQIEIYPTGDFVARSNNVASLYRRIDPNDWDDDGWHNGDDDDPIRKAEPFSEFDQSLPCGANPNAYCWIDIVTPYNSHVVFVGDGLSDLEDPALITGAGVTNRIQLLIGKTYTVSSDQPITITDMSSSAIEITGNGTCALSIVYPIEFSACDGNGGSFTMFTSPSGLTGAYEWTSYCCPITGLGNRFWYAHNWCCLCDGCQARGVFRYEGYSLPCDGGWCCCPCYYDPDYYYYQTQVDDGPYAASASVSFSEPAVIFEDAYTNRPGEVVSRRSTTTILTCTAHGGSEGTVATFWLSNGSKILRTSGGDLPLTQFVPPGQKLEFEVEYEGCQPSQSANDIVAYASISGSSQESSSELTSVKVQLTAVYEAPENPNPSRHVYGVGEKVRLNHLPQEANIVWQLGKRDIYSTLLEEVGCDNVLLLHYRGDRITDIIARYGECIYAPILTLTEPKVIICKNAEWDCVCSPSGQAGGFGMFLELYIGPMDVAFNGIDIAEIPCNTIVQPEGYYATTNFNGSLSHTYAAGAGRWNHVSGGNRWCQDDAYSNVRRSPWSDGCLVWNMPIQWYQRLENELSWPRGMVHSDGKLIGGKEVAYQQAFQIYSNGTITVEKHGHWIDRSTNDVIRLDGLMVHEGKH